MSDSIIVALITGIIGFLGNAFVSSQSNSRTVAVMDERIRDIKDDISNLSARVDKHNNLVERMAIVESSTKSAHKRLDDAGVGRSRPNT